MELSTWSGSAHTPWGCSAQRLLAWTGRLLAWPIRVAEARRVMRQLGAMSDHDLRDIGLVRQDLRDAAALRSDEDPGDMLQSRAKSRRMERRRAVLTHRR